MGYYLFAILPNICTTLTILAVICAICCVPTVVATIAYHIDGIDDFKFFKRIGKVLYPVTVLLILLNTFIPTQKQLAFIIAAPYIIENEDLQQAGKNTTEIIKLGTEYLKEILDDNNRNDNKTGEH
jgi:uncharacterized protein YqhQ